MFLLALCSFAWLSSLILPSDARTVYAHFMLGTIEEAHAKQDIDDAKAIGLDGFALNIGDPTQDFVSAALSSLFPYAESVGFKLFISMDMAAAGGKPPSVYKGIFDKYLISSAYASVDRKPLISTFSHGTLSSAQWKEWKTTVGDVFFLPNFDGTDGYWDGSDAWWSEYGAVVDGIFSWESAWPSRDGKQTYPGDISGDVAVMKGAAAHQKPYMIPVSALQFKASYGTNHYRPGGNNLPQRLANILAMQNPPEYVEIITWNDGPESHYIGNCWPEANSDSVVAKYAGSAWSHAGWQLTIKGFIEKYKGSTATRSGDAYGSMWYKTVLQTAQCSGPKPEGFETGDDLLHYAIHLPKGAEGWKVQFSINNAPVGSLVDLSQSFSFGNSTAPAGEGLPKIDVLDNLGKVVASATGVKAISASCADDIFNMNYQVVAIGTPNPGDPPNT